MSTTRDRLEEIEGYSETTFIHDNDSNSVKSPARFLPLKQERQAIYGTKGTSSKCEARE
jgi:hypothetical protein